MDRASADANSNGSTSAWYIPQYYYSIVGIDLDVHPGLRAFIDRELGLTNGIAARYFQDILTQDTVDDMTDRLVEYGRNQYGVVLATPDDFVLDHLAFRLLVNVLVALLREGRDNVVQVLLLRIAPQAMQTINDWYRSARDPSWIVNATNAFVRYTQPTDLGNLQPSNLIATRAPESFTASQLYVDAIDPRLQTNVTAQQPQSSFPTSSLTFNTNGYNHAAPTSSQPSAIITNPSFAPISQGQSEMAKLHKTSPSSRRSRSPRAESARMHMRNKDQMKQKERAIKSGRATKKASSSTSTKLKLKFPRMSRADVRKLGPEEAPVGQRYICPFHVRGPANRSPCFCISSNRRCLTKHVRQQHFNGSAAWGTQVRDWATCGPHTYAELRRRGQTNAIAGRKEQVPGQGREVGLPVATATAAVVSQSEDEEDEEEDEEDENEDEIMSDGDDERDESDYDDGNGQGHALAQLVAVA